jgi:hypothetical protein
MFFLSFRVYLLQDNQDEYFDIKPFNANLVMKKATDVLKKHWIEVVR